MSGWIKLWSKITEWEWYNNGNTFRVFLHLLLKANYKDKEWRGTTIRRGELITSIRNLSEELGLSKQQTRHALMNLQKTREITIKATNKWSRIIVENYERYQCCPDDEQHTNDTQTNTQSTRKATRKPTTTTEGRSIEEQNNNIYTPSDVFIKGVVDHLNHEAGTRYKWNTTKTKKHIGARCKEGYTQADFFIVIDKKCAEWKNTDMAKYLRPETLFGTKFESYLNQPEARQSTGNPFLDMLKEQEA